MLSNHFTAAAIVVMSSLLLIPSSLVAGGIRHEVEDVNIPAENGTDVSTTWWEVKVQTMESQSSPVPSSEGVAVPTAPAPPSKEPRSALNAIYFEALGAGFLYSINYERLVLNDLALRIGASAGSLADDWLLFNWIAVPISVSYLGVSTRSHSLEVGLGLDPVCFSGQWLFYESSDIEVSGFALVGYRFQPRKGGFQFRIGFSPPLIRDTIPWPYISFGNVFGRR